MSALSKTEDAVKDLGYISMKLREAIAASLPCAQEQYVTISIPGLIVDTRDDGTGSYILSSDQHRASDRKNEVACNEAQLVDSMIPLDTVMLGPTGKSVTRSYLSALDHLVPRKTDIGNISIELESDSTDPSVPKTKYARAMTYLKQLENDEKGNSMTTVGRYVEKQLAWADSQGEYTAAKADSADGINMKVSEQTAQAYSARQEKLIKARTKLQARYMDWVVNGNKFKVDHSFALVDRDTIMSRIGKAREITRSQIITSAGGVDWAQVHLEPSNWAEMCATRAKDWSGMGKAQLDSIELQITRLEEEKVAYDVYERHHKNATISEPDFPGKAPRKEIDAAKKERDTAETAYKTAKEETEEEKEKKKDLKKAYDDAEKTYNDKRTSSPEKALADSLKAIYEAEEGVKQAKNSNDPNETDTKKMENSKKELETAEKNLTTAKDNWRKASAQYQSYRTVLNVHELAEKGHKTLENVAKDRREIIDAQIKALQNKRTEIKAVGPPEGLILGVESTDYTKKAETDAVESSSKTKDGDKWTKVTFSMSSKSDSSSSDIRDWSGGASVKYSGLFASAEANNSWASSSAEIKKKMSQCSVSGSFSAMLVQIKRPWLHSEIFSDYSIDTMEGSNLSPGPLNLKKWIEKGEKSNLRPYGEFPSYPTAFIVAADTVLELASGDANSASLMTSLQTNTSAKASFGPWGISGDASLNTSNKTSNQSMEMRNGMIKISFQAPQIIGWVSEILPKLPRDPPSKDGATEGGLNGAPSMVFRAKL